MRQVVFVSGDRKTEGVFPLWSVFDNIAIGRVARQAPVQPVRQGDVPHSQADITAASERLGYRVAVPFAEGIARTVAWYREQAPTKTAV